MRNMKTLIKLMGAVTLSTAAASSVVACGAPQAAELNGKYAVLLGWYSAPDKSNIKQGLSTDYTKIILENEAKIKDTNFKTSLLTSNKAKDDAAAAFLKELGFTSGSKDKDYSTDDLTAINALKATIKSSNLGKIKEKTINGTDMFKIGIGTCQVEIMDKTGDGAKVVKSYTVNIAKNEALDIPGKVKTLIDKSTNLNLTAAEGFQKTKPVSGFQLKLATDANQKKFDSLVKLLNTKVLTKFYTAATGDTEVTDKFPNSNVFLQIIFGNKPMGARIDCGIPVD